MMTTGVHAKFTSPCPKCGGKIHGQNGRCYTCNPRGYSAMPKSPELKASLNRLDLNGEIATPAPGPMPSLAHPDPELLALYRVIAALNDLDSGQLRRVLSYIKSRFEEA